MINLLTAIRTKISGSALQTDVGDRIFPDEYPASLGQPVFPYVVYFSPGGNLEPTFSDDVRNRMMQFSLFSASPGVAEIAQMEADLEALLHDKDLTVTGAGQAWARKMGEPIMMTEEVPTPEGTQKVKHWVVEYEFTVSLN